MGPPLPPPVVVVPPQPTPIPDGDSGVDCSILSLSDRLALFGLQERASQQEVQQYIPSQVVTPEVVDVPSAINTGTLLEATDYFRFRAFSTSDNVQVLFFGRVVGPSGNVTHFGHPLQTAVPGTVYETVVTAGRGMLLGAAASVPINSITAGSVSAVGEVGRLVNGGFVPHTLLFSGALDDLTPLTASSASVSAPVEVSDYKIATLSGPAAPDSTVVITPQSGRQIRIGYVSGDYVCSGVAGNRQLTISFELASGYFWRGLASQYITASQSGVYRFAMGGQNESPTAALPGAFRQITCPLPESLWFNQAVTVRASAYGIQAGDTAGGGTVNYEER